MSGAIIHFTVMVYEVARVVSGIQADSRRGTTRNTTENLWGVLGATIGALIGYFAFYIIGFINLPNSNFVIILGSIGSAIGGISADHYLRSRIKDVFDRCEYDIETFCCQRCLQNYKCEIYTSKLHPEPPIYSFNLESSLSYIYCKTCIDK